MPVTIDDTLDPGQFAVLDALYQVEDPELGVNVVDLGLVRGVALESRVAHVTMTLTSAACPLTEELEDELRFILSRRDLADDLVVEWVFLPPWNISDVTPDGRSQLRALGF